MAAPPEVTIKDLSGKWLMNKALTTDPDPILALQGIGWMKRKAIGLASVTLHVKQYTDENGKTHVDVDTTATGGIKGTAEIRELDWTFRESGDYLFGKTKTKTRWVGPEGLEDPYHKEDWLEGNGENGGPAGESHIETVVESDERGWTIVQVWGFAIINGERRHTRRAVIKKGKEVLKFRIVYDWLG